MCIPTTFGDVKWLAKYPFQSGSKEGERYRTQFSDMQMFCQISNTNTDILFGIYIWPLSELLQHVTRFQIPNRFLMTTCGLLLIQKKRKRLGTHTNKAANKHILPVVSAMIYSWYPQQVKREEAEGTLRKIWPPDRPWRSEALNLGCRVEWQKSKTTKIPWS